MSHTVISKVLVVARDLDDAVAIAEAETEARAVFTTVADRVCFGLVHGEQALYEVTLLEEIGHTEEVRHG
jgi:hypothetical protein